MGRRYCASFISASGPSDQCVSPPRPARSLACRPPGQATPVTSSGPRSPPCMRRSPADRQMPGPRSLTAAGEQFALARFHASAQVRPWDSATTNSPLLRPLRHHGAGQPSARSADRLLAPMLGPRPCRLCLDRLLRWAGTSPALPAWAGVLPRRHSPRQLAPRSAEQHHRYGRQRRQPALPTIPSTPRHNR